MSPAAKAPAIIGVVLAGGRAQRLGGAKAGALLGGEPLLARAVSVVREAGLEPVVCARPDTALPEVDAQIWREAWPQGFGVDSHPLAGLAWALSQSAGPVVAVPVDLPFLPAEVIAGLASLSDPLAVLVQGGRPAALVVRAGPEHAALLTAAARAGAPALRTLLTMGAVSVEIGELTTAEPARALFNVNDAADLARAEALLPG